MTVEKTHNHPVPQTQGQTIPWARFYDTLVWLLSTGKDCALRQKTVELAQIKPGETVLDVGCGTGDLTLAAKAATGPTGQVFGTDASPQMVEQAQQKADRSGADVTFKAEAVEQMTFADNQFDVVLSSLMMHHLPGDLKQQALAEIYRVLKPGGRLLIVDMQSSRTVSVFQRLSDVMIQLHGGHTALENNVSKLVPLVETARFTETKTDKINRQFAYVWAQKPL